MSPTRVLNTNNDGGSSSSSSSTGNNNMQTSDNPILLVETSTDEDQSTQSILNDTRRRYRRTRQQSKPYNTICKSTNKRKRGNCNGAVGDDYSSNSGIGKRNSSSNKRNTDNIIIDVDAKMVSGFDGIFEESEDSMKHKRDLLLKSCQKYEKKIIECTNKISNCKTNIAKIRLELEELDQEIEHRVVRNRKKHRDDVCKMYVSRYSWAFTDDACPVCLELYKPSIQYDNCKHVICAECNESLLLTASITDDINLRNERNCPLCRTRITGYVRFNEDTLLGEHTTIDIITT